MLMIFWQDVWGVNKFNQSLLMWGFQQNVEIIHQHHHHFYEVTVTSKSRNRTILSQNPNPQSFCPLSSPLFASSKMKKNQRSIPPSYTTPSVPFSMEHNEASRCLPANRTVPSSQFSKIYLQKADRNQQVQQPLSHNQRTVFTQNLYPPSQGIPMAMTIPE